MPVAWRESTNTVMFGLEAAKYEVADAGSDATKWSSQRKTFYAKGRYWVFYVRESLVSPGLFLIVFRSTPDGGITWSPEYMASVEHYRFNDGSWRDAQWFFHYVQPEGYFDVYAEGDVIGLFAEESFYYELWSGYDYIFRKGIINFDGTITWDDPVEVYWSDSWYDSNYPAIARAADGTWWVASAVNTSGTDHSYKIWSSPDGVTFTERYSESFSVARYTTTQILPQKTGGVVYFVIARYYDNTTISWIKWDGSSMGSRQTKSISNGMGNNLKKERFSATRDPNNIMHMVWVRSADSSICYINWDGTTWGDETLVESVPSGITDPCIGVGRFVRVWKLQLFWLRGNVIYHREYDGSWQGSDTPFGTSFASPTYLTCGKDIGP